MNRNFRSLSKVIFISMTLIALASVISMGSFWIIQVSSNIRDQYRTISHDYLEQEKDAVRERVLELAQRIQAQYAELETVTEKQLWDQNRIITDVVRALDANPVLKKDLQNNLKQLSEIINSYRYVNGEPYHLVLNVQNKERIKPLGNDVCVFTNCLAAENGYRSVDDFYRAVYDYARKKTDRFYFYTRQADQTVSDKHQLVAEYIPELQLVVATQKSCGLADSELQQDVLSKIEKFRFRNEGYFFVNRYNGDQILTDGKRILNPVNLWELTDPNGVKVIQEERRAAEKPGGDFIYYHWRKLTNDTIAPKISYIVGIPQWEWLLGAGTYVDEIDSIIQQAQTTLARGRMVIIFKVIVISIVLLMLQIFIGRLITERMQLSMNSFIKFFGKASGESSGIDKKEIHYNEFRELADSANQMIRQRDIFRENVNAEHRKMISLFESVPIGLAIVEENKISMINDEFLRISGYQRPEVERDSIYKYLLNPVVFDRTLNSEGIVNIETGIIRKNGDVRNVLLSYLPLDPERSDKEWIFSVMDITELNEYKEQLEKHRSHLEITLRSIADGVLVTDRDGMVTDINPAALEIVEMERADVIGKHFSSSFQLFDIQNLSVMINPVDDVLKAKKYTAQTRQSELVMRQTGKRCRIAESTAPVINEDKSVLGCVMVFRDVTDQYEKEMALIESEERFRVLSENLQSGIFTYDDSFRFQYANARMCELTGYTKNELLNMPFWTIIHPVDRENVKMLGQRRFTGQIINSQYETQIQAKDGNVRYVIIASGRIVVNNRPMIIGAITDATSMKQAEETIMRNLQEKETLLSEIHHRVKNNMQVISSILRMQSRLVEDSDIRQYFKESENRVHTMAMIHEQLYQSSNLSDIKYSEYVSLLVSYIQSGYASIHKKIQIKVDIPADFRLTVQEAIPCGLMINELVSNSLKYAFPDMDSGSVVVKMYNENDHKIMIVEDSGAGLPTDIDPQKNNSLGLQIVRSLVKQLHGSAEYSNSPGFRVEIRF